MPDLIGICLDGEGEHEVESRVDRLVCCRVGAISIKVDEDKRQL